MMARQLGGNGGKVVIFFPLYVAIFNTSCIIIATKMLN